MKTVVSLLSNYVINTKILLKRDFIHVRTVTKTNYIATVQLDDKQGQPIQRWYCTCASGSCTLDRCTHITALLWHVEVMQSEIDIALDPLSATWLLGFIDDSILNSDTNESDDYVNGAIDFDD